MPNKHFDIYEDVVDDQTKKCKRCGKRLVKWQKIFCSYECQKYPFSIQEMHKIAHKMNGTCLSSKYINNRTKLLWQCAKKHQWKATPNHIKQGSWCPWCIGRNKTIKDMRKLAVFKNGKCLSGKYINNSTKLSWQCSKGHMWEATPNLIQQGHWCSRCYNEVRGVDQRLNIEEMYTLAKSRGGKCLSNKYTNCNTKLKWQCKEGHIWKAIPNSIKKGHWCPCCAGIVKKTIGDMRKLAAAKGGECLSENYINCGISLLWQCSSGHTWRAIPNSIKKGHWCPYCAGLAKKTIQEMRKLAQKRNGRCLSSNYINSRICLKWMCNKGHKWEAAPNSIKQGSWCPYCAGKAKKTIKDMHELAAAKNGKCLSDKYINTSTKLLWQCAYGHTWEAIPQKNYWCPYCAGLAKKTIQDMHEFASKKGGKCLSNKYVNSKTKLKWECASGHIWQAVPNDSWCPFCGGTAKKTIKDMHKLAAANNGKCLSVKYINKRTKLKWECSKGHKWETAPTNVQSGCWCPYCAGTKKKTIKDMHELASAKNGKCLSIKYINSNTKLKWQCKRNHIWKAKPRDIKSGTWCPHCYNLSCRKKQSCIISYASQN